MKPTQGSRVGRGSNRVLTVSFEHLNRILPEVSVTLGPFLFLRPRDSLLCLSHGDLGCCHLQPSLLPKAKNKSTVVRTSAWKPVAESADEGRRGRLKAARGPTCCQGKAGPHTGGQAPVAGTPDAKETQPSHTQDDLQQEELSPSQRSQGPGNHRAGVHSGLSGSRSSPRPSPYWAPASSPNPGESQKGLQRAPPFPPHLQLVLRFCSRGGQVSQEDCPTPWRLLQAPTLACRREGSTSGTGWEAQKPDTTGPGLRPPSLPVPHAPTSPSSQLEEGLWSWGAGPGMLSWVYTASPIFLTSTPDPRVPKPAAHTPDACVCLVGCMVFKNWN